MQTITLNQLKQNTDFLFDNFGKETLLLKNEQNEMYLLMPVNPEKWQEIFTLYAAISMEVKQNIIKKQSQTFEEFDKQWCGFMKDIQLPNNWRNEYINDKMAKHQ